ncbi:MULTISPECIES: nuclear transport factor 2 family protein [Streptomyces]|uniref:nuclear transport factor 2 family protein n=1 Tax=Streptomyces TaxID=1883 RepID=UPI00089C7C17|nr:MULTISPECIES: nuclear transport factor 2 family protein [Streptomyces]MDI5904831.1 nuclear transport factor 2 family protein [Streptomyces sp. 12257]SEC39935.1 SnoaL-like domain-containing protein [Streptomyces sp. 3213] [Streptomyces sp. 3213.3]
MSDTPHSAATTVARWRSALERGDVDAAAACLSADVVLVPPLTEQFHFEGPGLLRDFLASAFTAVEDIRLHTQTGEDNAYAVLHNARVGPSRSRRRSCCDSTTRHTSRRSRSSGVRCRPSPR